jgi:hypothetical protein
MKSEKKHKWGEKENTKVKEKMVSGKGELRRKRYIKNERGKG